MAFQNYGGARPRTGQRVARLQSGSHRSDDGLGEQRLTSPPSILRLWDSAIPARPGSDVTKEMDEILAGYEAEQTSARRAGAPRDTLRDKEELDDNIRDVFAIMPPASAPMPSRRSTIRDCDFCHKTYLASVDGNRYIEDLRPGAPERICNDCKYKPPATLAGTVKESLPGWFIRQPPSEEQAISSSLALLRSHRSADDDDDPATRYYSLQLARIPLYHRSSENLSILRHENLGYIPGVKRDEDRRLPPMEDCYMYPRDWYSARTKPCDKHPLPHPHCWVGKPFDSIPEVCHQRYWQNYMRDRQIGRLEYHPRTGEAMKSTRRMSRTIYQPKKWLEPTPELTNISEDEESNYVTAEDCFEGDDDETF